MPSNLSSSSDLENKIIYDNISQALEQSTAGFHVLVQPLPCFGEGCAATTLNHVGHQSPLRNKHTMIKNLKLQSLISVPEMCYKMGHWRIVNRDCNRTNLYTQTKESRVHRLNTVGQFFKQSLF